MEQVINSESSSTTLPRLNYLTTPTQFNNKIFVLQIAEGLEKYSQHEISYPAEEAVEPLPC